MCAQSPTWRALVSSGSEEEMAVLRPTLAKLNGTFTYFTRAFLTFDTVRRVGRRLFTGWCSPHSMAAHGQFIHATCTPISAPRLGLAGGMERIGRSSIFLAVCHEPTGEIVGVVDLSEQVT